jgi:hypothetical protein
MRTFLFIACLFAGFSVSGQIKTQVVSKTALPKNIIYQGKPVQAVQFQDGSGAYIALTTQTGTQPQKGDDEFKQAHLYGYVFQLKGGTPPTVLWQLHDMVTECNLDMVANFIPGSLTVTDLDKNGKAEVWVAYRLSCRGDVSPSELKIIMHEGTRKYAIRGEGRLKVGKVLQPGGGVSASDDFKNATVPFTQYARGLWNKYVIETMP